LKNRKRTKTSSFGVSKRESHDSEIFYKRKLYKDSNFRKRQLINNKIENECPSEFLDKIIFGDAYSILNKFPDNCIHLMVTSPPYNVGKEYDNDLTLKEYLDFIESIMNEIYRVLVWGGRVCFNIANLGRKPYIPLHSYLINIFEKIGFLFRGEIIWDKGESVSNSSTAWGSWMSASNPILRDQHEYIIVMSKGSFKREKTEGKISTITRNEFLELTRSIWRFPPESAKKIGHPAPFPEKLPYNCIQLYSYKDDIILDPFAGSGTTCIAAYKLNRHFIGIDNNIEYVNLALNRLKSIKESKEV